MTGTDIRLKRFFSKGENAVVVAIDHGKFDGPICGMIDMPEVTKNIDSEVSGLLLAPGMLGHCSHAIDYKCAPMPIVRINWSSVYAFHWEYNDAYTVQSCSVADAVAAGADIVLISLTLKTGCEKRDAANVELFCKLTSEAKHLGIPVIGEIFPAHSSELSREDMHDQVYRGCRIIAELGADMVKTFYTYKFKEVTEGCPVPILGLGADKTPKQIQALELAEKIVQDGGRGVVFGRNAIQVSDPIAFQKALCKVVVKGVSAADAAKAHGLKD